MVFSYLISIRMIVPLSEIHFIFLIALQGIEPKRKKQTNKQCRIHSFQSFFVGGFYPSKLQPWTHGFFLVRNSLVVWGRPTPQRQWMPKTVPVETTGEVDNSNLHLAGNPNLNLGAQEGYFQGIVLRHFRIQVLMKDLVHIFE